MVWVRRSDWERVTEREELVGRLREGSRLPQYLEFFCQMVVDGCEGGGRLLDHSDVYWSGRACSVDFMVRHVVGAKCYCEIEKKRSDIFTDRFVLFFN